MCSLRQSKSHSVCPQPAHVPDEEPEVSAVTAGDSRKGPEAGAQKRRKEGLTIDTAGDETRAEREAARLAKECIKACGISDIFARTKSFKAQPLTQLVRSLILGTTVTQDPRSPP